MKKVIIAAAGLGIAVVSFVPAEAVSSLFGSRPAGASVQIAKTVPQVRVIDKLGSRVEVVSPGKPLDDTAVLQWLSQRRVTGDVTTPEASATAAVSAPSYAVAPSIVPDAVAPTSPVEPVPTDSIQTARPAPISRAPAAVPLVLVADTTPEPRPARKTRDRSDEDDDDDREDRSASRQVADAPSAPEPDVEPTDREPEAAQPEPEAQSSDEPQPDEPEPEDDQPDEPEDSEDANEPAA